MNHVEYTKEVESGFSAEYAGIKLDRIQIVSQTQPMIIDSLHPILAIKAVEKRQPIPKVK